MAESELKEKLEEQIGECLGLERAAQKAVDELNSKGLLADYRSKIVGMREEAVGHEERLEEAIQGVVESEGLDSSSIEKNAEETVQKAAEMMKTYLGDNPDTLDALEFLCLAEGGEVTHYEVLGKLAPEVKGKKFATSVRSILNQEKRHLQLCTRLAKEEVAS